MTSTEASKAISMTFPLAMAHRVSPVRASRKEILIGYELAPARRNPAPQPISQPASQPQAGPDGHRPRRGLRRDIPGEYFAIDLALKRQGGRHDISGERPSRGR